MNYKNNSEVQRMKDLIKYGLNEEVVNTGGAKPILEYSQKAADGKVYGIVKECQRYYIKVAPNKDTKLMAEDYDYIGGQVNKRENEYTSYALASKQFDLKMMSINEAHSKKVEIEQFNTVEASEWQINETKEMRAELNRFKQITNNVAVILKEEKSAIPSEHTLPEAPASNPSEEKVNSPFTDTAVANGDKDFKKKQEDPKKAGHPFDNNGEVSDSDMQSDKKATVNGGSETYSEKPKFAPSNSVTDQHPSGGKATKVEEGKKRCIKLTEEQLLVWNNNKDYMDKSQGTEIGDTAPYTEETVEVNEENVVHNTDNQNSPAVGNGEIGDTAPFNDKVNEDTVDVEDVAGMPDDEDEEVPFPEVEDGGAYLDFEKDYNDWEDSDENGETGLDDFDYEIDLDDDAFDAANSDDDFYESMRRKGRRISEAQLNDFGKHPAYHKSPMTVGSTKEVSVNGARDWNDESAKSEEPYGKKIGSSSPYDKVIDNITRSIMKQLNFQKKA